MRLFLVLKVMIHFQSNFGSFNQIFVGGDGDDSYLINRPGYMTVFDGGYQDSDTVKATGIDLASNSSSFALVEGAHLFAYDELSQQGVFIFDYSNPISKIENIEFGSGSYDSDQLDLKPIAIAKIFG